MQIFDYWQEQREPLKTILEEQTELSRVTYQVRKALTQTEQNALAEMKDEILRQQAGVLMNCVKNAASLLEVNVVHQSWVARKAETEKPKRKFTWMQLASWGAMALLALTMAFEKNWLLCGVSAAALILSFLPTRAEQKAEPTLPPDEVKIEVKADTERLLQELDKQIRSVDRFLNDFTYLNQQLSNGSDNEEPITIAKASELMEAVTECDSENSEELQEIAAGLLRQLGMSILMYSPERQNCFSILPSKQITRTITPAILSAKDGHLLRRGTAAVKGALGE